MLLLKTAFQVGTIVLICLGSGCGSCDRKVHLMYNRVVGGVHSDQGGRIYVETPDCPGLGRTRNGSYVIGEVDHGGWGMYSGDTVTSDSVPKWIADALCVELKAAGFVPDVVDRLPPTADCGVSTRLTRVRADGTNISFALPLAATVDVCLRMAIHRGGKVVREFDVNGNDTGEVDESLTIALEDCMKKAIPLIVAGLEE